MSVVATRTTRDALRRFPTRARPVVGGADAALRVHNEKMKDQLLILEYMLEMGPMGIELYRYASRNVALGRSE